MDMFDDDDNFNGRHYLWTPPRPWYKLAAGVVVIMMLLALLVLPGCTTPTVRPVVSVGYFQTITTSWHTSADISGPMVHLSTNREGWGAHVRAGTGGESEPWISGGVHHGFTFGAFAVTPELGLSYSNTIHPNGYRQLTRFEVGLNLSYDFDGWIVSAGYLHLSNGEGLGKEINPTNVGQDGGYGTVGRAFDLPKGWWN